VFDGQQVHLSETWLVGERLGRGGYGHVHLATSDTETAVIKFVPKTPGAQRELLFATLDGVRNIVPILETGEHTDYYVMLMPKAELSLQDLLDKGSPLPLGDALRVIGDICDSLVDLDGKVVHRDLKPDNVLLLGDRWCLADFGISRYAEASTAPDTRKFSKTPPYAAPEQWRDEHATAAADMYALGVMAFEMLVGHRPFPGPSRHDFREQHLHSDIPEVAGVPTGPATLVEECLDKASAARPTPANFRKRLDRWQANAASRSGGLASLEEANQAEVKRRSAASRQQSEAKSEQERHDALKSSARRSLTRISTEFREAIESAAPAARSSQAGGGWAMTLGDAVLTFSGMNDRVDTSWGGWDRPAFEVIAVASVDLRCPPNMSGYEGRSHSLWFGDVQHANQYGWFECGFMITPSMPYASKQYPFALVVQP